MSEIRIAVLGGSKCGKRSVLACMDRIIDRIAVIDKYLSMTRHGDSFSLLNEKYAELEAYFSKGVVDFCETQSTEVEDCVEYRYALEYRKRPLGLDLCVTEISSRLLNTAHGINRCSRIVSESHILLLVIDTPAMMEEPSKITGLGKFHFKKNQYEIIQDIVCDGMSKSIDHKFVIFVPAKCEKYEHNNTLGEVNGVIKKSYQKLIDIAKSNCACAMVPVQTMGNADFKEIQADGKFSFRVQNSCTLMPQWSDLLLRMIMQYVFCMTLYFLRNPKKAKKSLGKKLVTAAGENKLVKFKRENGALINNAVDKQEIEAYEVLSDRVADTEELQIRRKLADFNVLMFGPRRAGKSSVLASMIHSFYQMDWAKMNDLSLQEGDEFTREYLANKREELKYSVDKARNQLLTVSMTEAATDTTNNYVFNMRYGSAQKTLTLDFMDIPGERLMGSRGEWDVWLRGELRNCQIIIVAIDTPHLMEEDGKYNDAFNRPQKIFDLFKSARMDTHISRLVLFVPIKCEKYYHEDRMEEVKEAVKRHNANLLSFLKSQSKTTVAITPILTMGGIVFDSFEVPGDGMPALLEQGRLKGRPKKVNYKLYEKDPLFRPQFCEQPMVYLLSFILATSPNGGMTLGNIMKFIFNPWKSLKRLLNLWKDIEGDSELRKTLAQVMLYLETEQPGFEFIQNPL